MASPKAQALFQKAVDDFLDELPDKRRSQFKNTTLDDLQLEIAQIQHEEAKKRSRSRLPTIQPFLEAFNRYAVVMDVFAQSTPFMPFIWGPVRFLLQISSRWLPAREKLLKALERIGKDLPFIDKNASYLTKARFEDIVVDIYVDTLCLLRLAVRIIGSSRLERFAGALWPPFDSQLDEILEKFRQDSEYLEKALREEQFDAILDIRAKARYQISISSHSLKLQNLQLIQTALQDPSMFYQELQRGKDIRTQFQTSGDWLLENDKFKQWLQMDSSNPVLRLSGMPGAGKTMLCSVVASETVNLKGINAIAIAVFCSYDNIKSSTCLGVLASTAIQLIHQVPYSHEAVIHRFGANFSRIYTIENLMECIELILISAPPTYLIVDGIDEMQQTERKLLLNCILKLSKVEETSRLRVLVSSRAEADIESLLMTVPEIMITAELNEDDINRYLLREETIKELQDAIDVERETVEEFLKALILKVDGMFLYARVVLDILKSQTSNLKQMREVVENNPDAIDGLKVAYYRILERIDQQHKNVRKPARRILKLLLAATSPLRVQEVKYAVALDKGTICIDDENRLRRTLEFYCGPIIEVHNGYVRLVHKTAGDYLLQHSDRLLNLTMDGAERLCARLTARYLSCCQFDVQEISDTEKLKTMILRGDYVWMNYAFQSWFKHALKASPRKQAVEALCERVLLVPSDNGGHPLQKYEAFCTEDTFCTDTDPSELRTIIIKVVNCIRNLEDDDDFDEKFRKIYGSGAYKCNRPTCRMFLEGFQKKKKRDDHEQLHTKISTCEIEGCNHLITSRKMLEQHMLLFHKIDISRPDATVDYRKRKASSVLNNLSQTKSPNDSRLLMDAIECNDIESTLLALKSIIGPIRRIKPLSYAKTNDTETWPDILREALTRAAALGQHEVLGAISLAGSFNYLGTCPLREADLERILQKQNLNFLNVWLDLETWEVMFERCPGEMQYLKSREFLLYLGFKNCPLAISYELGSFGHEAVEKMIYLVAGFNDISTITKILEFIRQAASSVQLNIRHEDSILIRRGILKAILKDRWLVRGDELKFFVLDQLRLFFTFLNPEFSDACARLARDMQDPGFCVSSDDFFTDLEVADLEIRLIDDLIPPEDLFALRKNLEQSASILKTTGVQMILENIMMRRPPSAIFSVLLDYYSGIHAEGFVRFHPLFIAPDVQMIEKLLGMGAPIDVWGGEFKQNAFNHQALHMTPDTVANICFLARKGADIHAVDEYGDNALVNNLVKCREETKDISAAQTSLKLESLLVYEIEDKKSQLEVAIIQLNERLLVIQLLVGLGLEYGTLMKGRMSARVILEALQIARNVSSTTWEVVMDEWKSVPFRRYIAITSREELMNLPIDGFKQELPPSLSILRLNSSMHSQDMQSQE